jgi:hypothetical protein
MTPEINAVLNDSDGPATSGRRQLGRLAAVVAAGAMSLSVVGPAMAQPEQRGLVNVNVGDVTILEDVGIGVAANVAANICGVQVNAAVVAEQVVLNDEPLAVCETGEQDAPVTITT